jgi:hypothetical protein
LIAGCAGVWRLAHDYELKGMKYDSPLWNAISEWLQDFIKTLSRRKIHA